MNTELPLGDKPPEVEITNATTLRAFGRMSGMLDAKEIITNLGFKMPGIKLAESAIQAEIGDMRCRMLLNLQVEAQKAGVDFSRWCVSGMKPVGDKWFVDFKSMEQVDEELSKP